MPGLLELREMSADTEDPPPPRQRVPWYLWPNVLGLDAPVIAVLWFYLLCVCILGRGGRRLLIEPSAPILLFLAVWVIYVADRWIDSRRQSPPATVRHRFQTTRGGFVLRLAAGAGVLLGLWLAVHELPVNLLYFGLFLAGLISFYFLLAQLQLRRDPAVGVVGIVLGLTVAAMLLGGGRGIAVGLQFAIRLAPLFLIPVVLVASPVFRIGTKELLAGALFAVGTFAPAYFHHRNGVPMLLGATTLCFAVLCALNCTLVSLREEKADTPRLPRHDVWLLAVLALGCGVVGWRYLSEGGNRVLELPVLVCIGASALLLIAVHGFRSRFSPELHRTLVDVALLTPLAALPFL